MTSRSGLSGDVRGATAPLRCYIAGVQHECSSFSPIPTEFRSFETVRWGIDADESTLGFGYGESCRIAVGLGFDLLAGPRLCLGEPGDE